MPRPVVRLVVLNYNGGAHLERCVAHLEALDWPEDRLDLVVVDNASTDGSVDGLEQSHPRVRVQRLGTNTGFPANNVALRDLEGIDHVGLINNDAFVTPGYLHDLVAALEADPTVGAACPKILLAPRFRDVEIRAEARTVEGDPRPLAVRLSGVRAGEVDLDRDVVPGPGFWDAERGPADEPTFRWTAARATLRVPDTAGGEVALRLAADVPTTVEVRSGGTTTTVEVGTTPTWSTVPVAGEPYDVVNNAGSRLVRGGWGGDRGFLERDEGQFDEPREVFAWCGAGVLFSPRYLADAGLFDERFFMYYEDTDLSWRGRTRGWRYQYVPTSVLRHVHAATSVEGSSMFNHYVERNRLVMLAKNAPPRYATRAAARFVLSTASYARRDVVRPLLRGHRPRPSIVRARIGSFAGFLRLLPAAVRFRRAAPPPVVHPDAVLGWEGGS
jgi:GT2 family glycosyltransferase